jgi:phosphoglucomutase
LGSALAKCRKTLTRFFTRSGLRKKVTVFQQPHYSEAFVVSILLSIPEGAEGEDERQLGWPHRAMVL